MEPAECTDRVPHCFGPHLRLDAAGSSRAAVVAVLDCGDLQRGDLDRHLDGYLARKHNIITRFGKLADPIADKALTGMAFIGLSIIGELPWWVTVTILVREWGITIMRFVVLRYGVMAAGRGGKIKTVTQAIAVILYLLRCRVRLHVVAVIVMAVAWVITMATGLDYIRGALRLRRRARAQ